MINLLSSTGSLTPEEKAIFQKVQIVYVKIDRPLKSKIELMYFYNPKTKIVELAAPYINGKNVSMADFGMEILKSVGL
jgi:hypothetical protein